MHGRMVPGSGRGRNAMGPNLRRFRRTSSARVQGHVHAACVRARGESGRVWCCALVHIGKQLVLLLQTLPTRRVECISIGAHAARQRIGEDGGGFGENIVFKRCSDRPEELVWREEGLQDQGGLTLTEAESKVIGEQSGRIVRHLRGTCHGACCSDQRRIVQCPPHEPTTDTHQGDCPGPSTSHLWGL